MSRGKFNAIPFTNPENDKEVWSGRGRHPKWLTMLLEKTGKTLVNTNGVWSLTTPVEDAPVATTEPATVT